MNRDEFRQAITRHGTNCDDFADLIGRHRETVYKFGETTPVPHYVRLILRLLDERGGTQGLVKSKITAKYK